MTIEIKVPQLPESVADATVAKWYKKPGDAIKRDEKIVDVETDKVILEVPASTDGILEKILKPEGATVLANEVIAILQAGTGAGAAAGSEKENKKTAATQPTVTPTAPQPVIAPPTNASSLSPSTRRLVAEHTVDIQQVSGTGKAGRVTREDVLKHLESDTPPASPVHAAPSATVTSNAASPSSTPSAIIGDIPLHDERPEKRVPMSRLRARIAERLVAAQHNAAMLTTFNEINMKPIMDLRARYKEQFEKKHGVKLGLMSFFVKAAVEALKRFPSVNASIDGNDVVYHGYYDIGIAVSTERGLVVPVVRDASNMSLAAIEQAIAGYAEKARTNKLSIEEITGGTFTLTNGGIFGSMLSTPILNPPQSAILGMHNIVERPVVENKEVVICPIMYLALSYDHRIIDGRESVTFLVTIKQLLEEPARLLLEI